MSAFNLALESGDVEHNEAPLANGEETHTVANAIAEAEGLAQEAADAEGVASDLDDEQEQTEELAETVEAEVAQEGALDPTAARLLHLSFRNIVGKQQAAKLPATESWAGTRAAARENTRMALESIKDTLKQFWEAIKAQFKKVYAKVKDWIVKTFSTAKKLKDRAEKLQSRANGTVGTIEDKQFSFGQTKAIAVDGKYNEPGALLSGLKEIRGLITGTISELKKDAVDGAIEDLTNALKGAFTGSGKTRSLGNLGNLTAAVKKGVQGASTKATPATVGDVTKYNAQYGEASEVDVTGVFGLPGGKAVLQVAFKGTSSDIEGAVKELRTGRLVLASDRYQARDVTEGDVKTLNTSQVDKLCEDVIEIAESVYGFEKNWKENERVVEKVQKEVDDIVKDFDREDEADARDQRHFRNFANGAMAALRRHANFKASLCSYAISTGNAFLNYGERSLGQHKTK